MSEKIKKEESKEQPNAFLISKELAVALINYLDQQKHGEVRNLISALEKSRSVNVNSDTE